jgi:ABC-type polysaccharide/polyol phosphate export permease
MIKEIINLYSYRELIFNLTARDIKQRYKQSVLGYFWVILNPFLQMLVMTFVFSTVMRIPSLGLPYPIFLYAGLLPWTLFANTMSSSANSLVENSALIKKIYFPREIFPLSITLAKIIDFFLASIVFVAYMIFYNMKINFNVLWFLPIFLIQFIFMFGLSLILSAANLFYRDIQYLLNLIILLLFYLTPVIYPVELLPIKYRFIVQLNPMAVLINAYRQSILGGGTPKLSSLGIAFLVSLLVFIFGYWLFKKLEGLFADVA